MAKCLGKFLGDDDLAKELGARGRQMAETRFTQNNYVAKIEAIYDEL